MSKAKGLFKRLILLMVIFLMTAGLSSAANAADYSSDLLSQIQPYYTSSSYYGRYKEGEALMGSQTYADCFMLNSFNNIDAEAAFYLEGKYKSISFTVGTVIDDINKNKNPRTLTVYCDNKAVCEKLIGVDDLPQNSGTINLSGVKELKFVVSGSPSTFWTGIGNIKLSSGGYTREERMKPVTSNFDVTPFVTKRYSTGDVVMGDKNFKNVLKFNSYNNIEAYAVYDLQNKYKSMSFWVGNEKNSVDHQNRTVSVIGDGRTLYSKEVCTDDAPVYAAVSLAGVSKLEIRVSGSSSSYTTVVGGINLVSNPVDISGAAITVEKVTYTGNELKPQVTVKYNGNTLTENKDYTVSYSDNVAAGTGTVVVKGIGNYTGSATVKFTIDKADISKASVSAASAVYTGKKLQPKVTVKYNGKTLINNNDYTVSYSNNTAVGTGKTVVKGTGNYTGSVTKTFSIKKAEQKLTVKVSSQKLAVGKTSSITAKASGKITYASGNAKIATVTSKGKITAKAPGKVTITVKAAEGKNYKSAKKTFTLVVNPKGASLTSAKNDGKGKVTLKWKKISGVTGYQIKYVVGSSEKTVSVKKASAKSVSVKKLKKGKTYKFYIRSYKTVKGTNYYSSWSKVKSIKVKK